MNKTSLLLALIVLFTGCSSTRNLGMILKNNTAEPGSVITSSQPYKEIGNARGRACRYFLLGVIPFGDSTVTKAIDKALKDNGGNALINVSVTTSLYGFLPVGIVPYNVFSFTCTSVEGIAIAFETSEGSN